MGIRDRNQTAVIQTWIERCLKHDKLEINSVNIMSHGSGCQVWDCLVDGNAIVLKVYAPGFDDYSRLGPVDTARKYALALMELPAFKVLTPRCLGLAVKGNEAALVMEKIVALPFTSAHRVAAARVLAKLHSI